jgi:hypothetical protein
VLQCQESEKTTENAINIIYGLIATEEMREKQKRRKAFKSEK